MAIEFHCPYCTAVIRVADALAGRRGRCPKCDTVLIIPNVAPPIPVLPAADTQSGLRQTGETVADNRSERQIPSMSPSALPGSEPTTASSGITKPGRRRPRRRTSRVWIFGLPIIMFLILFGILATFMMNRMPELAGELNAEHLTDPALTSVNLPWSVTRLDSKQSSELEAILREEADVFRSDLMVCSFAGTPDGISIQLSATESSSWYRVDPADQGAIALWLRKNQPVLGTMRVSELQKNAAEYCSDKIRKKQGESVMIDAASYRDAIGLNGRVSGLGFLVEAVTQGRAIRCASEDEQGRLYFALPRGLTSFQIRGRTLPDGVRHFPGKYTVQVVPQKQPSTPAPDAKTEPNSDSKADTDSDSKAAIDSNKEDEADMEMEKDTGTDKMSPENMQEL